MPGSDWVRTGADDARHQDLRVQMLTDDGATILLHYDVGLIRESERFSPALRDWSQTTWEDQYMRMVPEFIVGDPRYQCSKRASSLLAGE
jgi:hypothetical protein